MGTGSPPAYLVNPPGNTGSEPLFLDNNGFFPRIELRDFDTRHQIDNSYNEERRLDLLQTAMRQTNRELLGRVWEWLQAGFMSLDTVPQGFLGNCNDLVCEYRAAIYACAMMNLNRVYRGTDTKEYAVPKATNMETAAVHYEREYRRHLLALLGEPGTTLTAGLL